MSLTPYANSLRYVSASAFASQEIERLELSEPLERLELAAVNYQLSTKDLTPSGWSLMENSVQSWHRRQVI
jgi:hypothetical protein